MCLALLLTAVGKNDGIGCNKVEANAADRQTSEHDARLWVVFKRLHRSITFVGIHAPIDPGVLDVGAGQLVLNHIQKRSPLREDDDLGAGVLQRGLHNLQHRLRL